MAKSRLTQVHRALQPLGITLIPAYSPEARGRSERVFRTRQDRLPKELALVGITDMAAANQYLGTQFLPAYNRRFAVAADEAGTAFVPWIGTNLPEILCVHEERVVAKDPGVGPVLTTTLFANLPRAGNLDAQRSGGLSGRRAIHA